MLSQIDDSYEVGSRNSLYNLIRVLCKQTIGLNICHINAQSLNNKMDEFRYIFEESGMDIICVSETWFHCYISDNIYMLNGYRLFRSDRSSKGGGVAIYVRLPIQCKLLCESNDTDENTFKMQYLFLEIISHGRKLLLGTVYRPNNNIDIEPLMHKVSTTAVGYSNVVINGDFNSNILVNKSLMDDMNAMGLNLINKTMPTHFTSTSATLLDLFFTESLSRVLLYDQLSASLFSRHDLIFLSYDFKISLKEEKITFRDFKNIDMLSLEDELLGISWNQIYTMPTVDEQILFLHNNIQYLYEKFVPVKTKMLRPTEKPWFSNRIKLLINDRNEAYERWKIFKTPELEQIFKNSRRKVNTEIRSAKCKFYEAKFSTVLSSKRKWKEIRDMGVINKNITIDKDIDVNQLNADFANIPMPGSNINFYNSTNTLSHQNSIGFQLANVSIEDVYNSLHSIKSDSTGIDGIHPKFLKLILNYIIRYISHMFNTIITTAEFPSMWKHAKIIPIPKPDKTYRPIAILPYLSKAFERLVHTQINQYLGNSSLLTCKQSGFRPKHSCITALVDVAEDLRSKTDKNMISILVLLDHSKAFDTVDHHILCHKLRNVFNFSSSAVKLIRSYLCDRRQSVHNGDMKSTSCLVKRGVPQGSILGPLLYTIYSNDLPSQIEHCKIHMYADDVQLYISCLQTDINTCIQKLNRDLNNINTWASANGLCLNARKSKAIIIGKLNRLPNSLPPLLVGNTTLEIVQNAKNLGIVFNDQLNWANHVNVICGKTYAILRNLWKTQYFTPLNTRILLAKTYLIPTLLYGCELYAGLDSLSNQKLNTTYNNIARYIYGCNRYDRISHLSKQIYNMSLNNLLQCRTLIFLHKIIYTKQPTYLYNRLQFSISNRGCKINSIRYQKLISERHFYVNAIRSWNQLPSKIQLISNAKQFKHSVFAHMS